MIVDMMKHSVFTPNNFISFCLISVLCTVAPYARGGTSGQSHTDDDLTEVFEILGQYAQASGDDLLDDDSLLDDDDLLGDDDLLDDDNLLEEAESNDAPEPEVLALDGDARKAHADLFAESRYPSANTCKTCHPNHYREWSVSQHAYAQLSPVYMAMQNKINALTSSTNGDFCIRCHNQVGMNMGESTSISNLERHPTSREGITCVVCHRVEFEYGKVSGRVGLVEGGLLSPVYGPSGNEELKRVLSKPDEYKVVTDPDKAGRKIHTDVKKFPQISTSAFCGSCHDVNLFNGFRLEEAFSEHKSSPAAAAGVSCQDCHMGTVQGLVSGFNEGPAAIVGGVETKPRKLTNHFFAGPDYSIVHPGIFPHNADAAQMATLSEWLQFDDKAGWGTDDFEDAVADDYEFPERWGSIDDRYDAREIIDGQYELLDWAREKRLEVLRNGYVLSDIVTQAIDRSGIKFKVSVRNGIDAHNVPTGFIGERLVWLHVVVKDPDGNVIFESGDLDPNGDVRDLHSLYVHNGELPLDNQLFSLQSKFITRNIRGGEREQVLSVNYSIDPLPFIRPSVRSTILTGQPAGARIHRLGIPPASTRWARYRVGKKHITSAGAYTVTVRLKAGMVPVNLINEIKDVGFDYGMTTKEVAERVVAGHEVLSEKWATFEVK